MLDPIAKTTAAIAPPEISGISRASLSIDSARRRAEAYNETEGHLGGVDCEVCKNRGHMMTWDENGNNFVVPCQCMAKRKSLYLMKISGLGDLANRYTLDRWQEKEKWQTRLRQSVEAFAQKPDGWFYLSGRPGTGKTHLCTALCFALMEQGKEVRYLLWRDFAVKAKSCVNDTGGYKALVQPYKDTPVLYVDDLFKTGKGAQPTEGDVNLAFELLNARYNKANLTTIISSELSAEQLLNLDEGLGSRIYERSRNYYYDLSGHENWRLTGGN